MPTLFDIGVATIFAREFLEGAIIVGNYRTVIQKSDDLNEEEKKQKLRAVTVAASIASAIAVVMIVIVAIPLAIASKQFDNRVAEIIEGVSKLVAAIAILGLSLKIPVWLGVYDKVSGLPWKRNKKKEDKHEELLPVRDIRFNVAWNIWREVAECGVFLLPYFLNNNKLEAIPISAVIGVVIALVIALIFFYANSKLQNKLWIAIAMVTITLLLAIGLFAGGCHEFEEVLCLPEGSGVTEGEGGGATPPPAEGAAANGTVPAAPARLLLADGMYESPTRDVLDALGAAESRALQAEAGVEAKASAEGSGQSHCDKVTYYCTATAYCIETEFWRVDRFPMAIFKPFGYSHKPTVLQIGAWWAWFALAMILHGCKWFLTKQNRAGKISDVEAAGGGKEGGSITN